MRIRKTFVAALILLICLSLAGVFIPDYDCPSPSNGKFRLCRQLGSFCANCRYGEPSRQHSVRIAWNWRRSGHRHSEELAAAGINSIFADVNDRVIYFEYAEGIMWATGFGILYAADEPGLPEWYRLEPIEDRWYFYIVES